MLAAAYLAATRAAEIDATKIDQEAEKGDLQPAVTG